MLVNHLDDCGDVRRQLGHVHITGYEVFRILKKVVFGTGTVGRSLEIR